MKAKGRILVLAGVALLVIVAIYAVASRTPQALQGSGTIEARNIRVGSKVGGRIAAVHVREGDHVEGGQVLVTFEDQELLAGLEQARATLEKLERGFRPEEVAEARAAAAQAAALHHERAAGNRQEHIAAAHADVERARAEALRARQTYERVTNLAHAEVFSKQQRDDATGAHHAAEAALAAAEERFAELQRGFRPEQIQAAEAAWKQAEARKQLMERGYRAEDVAVARAALREAETRYRERQVLAPAAATVEVLDIRPGDLVTANTAVATLLERDQVFVRIYIPETEIGRVHVGQQASLRVDSFPGREFSAVVEQINQKAEFLPRNVQTRAERVHQVFGVKLRITDPENVLRPGMSADVRLK
jgi:multidrug resistance efflux pump